MKRDDLVALIMTAPPDAEFLTPGAVDMDSKLRDYHPDLKITPVQVVTGFPGVFNVIPRGRDWPALPVNAYIFGHLTGP